MSPKYTVNENKKKVFGSINSKDSYELKSAVKAAIRSQTPNIGKINEICIQNSSKYSRIVGWAEFFNENNDISKQYFEINLVQKNPKIDKTTVHLTISDEPFTFTPKYHELILKSIKQNYKIGTMAAIALVAIVVSAGMAPLFSDLTPETKTAVLSETEGQIILGDNAVKNHNYLTAQYHYANSLQKDPGNIHGMTSGREAYLLASSDNLFPDTASLITIDSDGAMIYPEKEKGFVIPEKSDSHKLDYPGNIPVVYPDSDGKYPTIIFDRADITKAPVIIAPDEPRLGQAPADADDKIVIQPIYREGLDEIQYAETANPDGSLVVYPYGFGDGPALIFPDQSSYPIVAENVNFENQAYHISHIDSKITPSDIIPIQYTQVNLNDISNVPNNVPVRVLGGPNDVTVDFPLGLDGRPIVNYDVSTTPTTTATAATPTTTATAATPTTTAAVTTPSTPITIVRVSSSPSNHGSSFSGVSSIGMSGLGIGMGGSLMGCSGCILPENGQSTSIAAIVGEEVGESLVLEDEKKNSVTISGSGPSSHGFRTGPSNFDGATAHNAAANAYDSANNAAANAYDSANNAAANAYDSANNAATKVVASFDAHNAAVFAAHNAAAIAAKDPNATYDSVYNAAYNAAKSSYGSSFDSSSYESNYGMGTVDVGALTIVSSADSEGYFGGGTSGATAAPESPIGSIALVVSMLSIVAIFAMRVRSKKENIITV